MRGMSLPVEEGVCVDTSTQKKLLFDAEEGLLVLQKKRINKNAYENASSRVFLLGGNFSETLTNGSTTTVPRGSSCGSLLLYFFVQFKTLILATCFVSLKNFIFFLNSEFNFVFDGPGIWSACTLGVPTKCDASEG